MCRLGGMVMEQRRKGANKKQKKWPLWQGLEWVPVHGLLEHGVEVEAGVDVSQGGLEYSGWSRLF